MIRHRADGDCYWPEPFELQKLPDTVAGPLPTPGITAASGFPPVDINDPPERIAILLRFLIEVQRHDVFPGLEGHHVIGGSAELTTIMVCENGEADIRQRVIARWDDRIGERIEPGPIDWPAWKAARGLAPSAITPAWAPGDNARALNRQRRRALASERRHS